MGLEDPDFTSVRAIELLGARDHVLRLSAAGELPPLEVDVALAGAASVYHCCQLFVDRSRPSDVLEHQVIEATGKLLPTADVVHALDLTFSFLPDLHAHARQMSAGDGLMRVLDQIARQWPMSGVGLPGNEPAWERFELWWGDVSLKQTYIDRVLSRDDATCLEHPLVRRDVRACLGERVEALAGEAVCAALLAEDYAKI